MSLQIFAWRGAREHSVLELGSGVIKLGDQLVVGQLPDQPLAIRHRPKPSSESQQQYDDISKNSSGQRPFGTDQSGASLVQFSIVA